MNRAARARGLGRGLDALFAPAPDTPTQTAQPQEGAAAAAGASLMLCALDKLKPNRGQPRQRFGVEGLEELARSIEQHGLLEPLVVRRCGQQDQFEIVAGERRWRAAQKAGLREVPVHVLQVEDDRAFELAVVENVQREDLDPMEFAEALERLSTDFGHSTESLAALLKKNRSTIANALRLLKLPAAVREQVSAGRLSEGHARAVLAAPDEPSMVRLARKAMDQRWSVRQTEAAAKALKTEANRGPEPQSPPKSAGVRDLETRLQRRYGARCEVHDRNGKGEIRLRYSSLDELDGLLERLLEGH